MKKMVPWILIGLGILLRLRQYFFDRSLWLDEALLARNIIERSFTGLLQPLGYQQNAPIGFILLAKLATVVGGNTSLALRFFPLVFGIISIFLFYRVARHFLKGTGTFVALTFFSLGTPAAYYSGEFKQYTGDLLATVILWYFFLVARPKHPIWLGIIGAVILWFSHASLFVLAAFAVTDLTLWTYAVPLWALSFGLDYLLFLRHNLSPVVIRYWQSLFLVFPWQIGSNYRLWLVSVVRMFGFFVDADTVWAHALVLVLGYWQIAKKNWKHIVIFVLPIILVIVATGLQKYPFVPRLLLFLAPSIYIALGAGVDYVAVRGRRWALIFLIPLLLWGTVQFAAQSFVTPIKVEELGKVLEYLHAHYQPGDIIYIYYAAEAPFRFYAPKYLLGGAQVIVGVESRDHLTGYLKDISKLQGNPRVWVVFSHIYRQSYYGEDRFIAGFLDGIGKRLDYYPQVGASLYLYDLR